MLFQSPKFRRNWKTLLKKWRKKLRLTPYNFDHFWPNLNFFQMWWKMFLGPLTFRKRCLMLNAINFKSQNLNIKKVKNFWNFFRKAAITPEPLQRKVSNGKLRLTIVCSFSHQSAEEIGRLCWKSEEKS